MEGRALHVASSGKGDGGILKAGSHGLVIAGRQGGIVGAGRVEGGERGGSRNRNREQGKGVKLKITSSRAERGTYCPDLGAKVRTLGPSSLRSSG